MVQKKKVIKKSKKKKVSNKCSVVRAPTEHRFWASNGYVLCDINDLATCLKDMNNDQFKHHVNSEKNDFANWVEDILQGKELAKGLRKIKTKAGTLKKVKECMN